MANSWTKEQKQAIDTEGRNILVSAAAGSGKTAVLVERIIRKITDEEHPVDIDRLVVVTFTKAAAAEMKQRIRESVDGLLEQQPDNDRLLRQLTLINNAQITTIDSFCLNIVRNYFTDIDIDPGFRTADEGEIKLLENDVMADMLEEYYASEEQDFYDFVDAYGKGRDDSAIIDIILKIYRFARSYPWPDEWYDSCLSVYQLDDASDAGDTGDVDDADGTGNRLTRLFENPAVRYLMNDISYRLESYDRQYDKLEEICASPQGPSMYLAAVQSDHAGIRMLREADNFAELTRRIRLLSFDALGRGRVKDVSEEKKEYVKSVRNEYKDYINDKMKGKLFTKDIESMIQDVTDNRASVGMMIALAKDFSQRMQEEKKERNIIDFNDMEHMALDVLVRRGEDGSREYTTAAETLSKYYEEILIDEYQDSNMLQEVILTAISRGRENPELNNIYMVGDVKQSIYKFRLACPELFIGKYNAYTREMSPNVKIELQTNFRSRANVLESTNDVFMRAMNPEYSGIAYDENARLNPGFDYPESEESIFDLREEQVANQPGCLDLSCPGSTDILLAGQIASDPDRESNQEADKDANQTPELSSREVEAEAIAKVISQLHDRKSDGTYHMVYDKRIEGGYRQIRYSDIVILTRTVTGWADTFVNTLMSHGIPAYSDASQGYFNVREIKLILNYLAVIDNPLQDIPMAAVMLSYFGRFDTDELTRIRVTDSKRPLYQSLSELESQKPPEDDESEKAEDGLIIKIRTFLSMLKTFRMKSEIMSIHDLLWQILYDTGYYNYVGTMPAGERRQANLDMLLEKAAAFEGTSYNGLFNFLRYIERIQKFEVDFGEACLLGENEDLVRVMSIHKSKGLEFPVVILAGMGKSINKMDAMGEVVIDQDLGIGTNVYHLDKRVKSPTFIKTAVSNRIVRESISEELRVLYVAMTRAREKLIMTGYLKDPEKSLEKWKLKAEELCSRSQDEYTYSDLAGCSTYYDVVMPVALLSQERKKGIFTVQTMEITEQDLTQDIDEIGNEELNQDINQDINEDTNQDIDQESKPNTQMNPDQQNENSQALEASEDLVIPPYPYATDGFRKMKITVSELKKMQHDVDMDQRASYPEQLKEALDKAEQTDKAEQIDKEYEIPEFIQGKKKVLAGNERGTAYHRVMECLDYLKVDTAEMIREQMLNMVNTQKMTQSQADSVNPDDIYAFCTSEIGQRVKKAATVGRIRREQPFVFAVKEADMQLVQGVIDLYLSEEDELTIVDYKTDRVPYGKRGEEELVHRYQIQLDYYAKALEQLTGLKVKEKVIYSFTLSQAISIKEQ